MPVIRHFYQVGLVATTYRQYCQWDPKGSGSHEAGSKGHGLLSPALSFYLETDTMRLLNQVDARFLFYSRVRLELQVAGNQGHKVLPEFS
jgi:hypothetical protein